jgi:hypothetical protein
MIPQPQAAPMSNSAASSVYPFLAGMVLLADVWWSSVAVGVGGGTVVGVVGMR